MVDGPAEGTSASIWTSYRATDIVAHGSFVLLCKGARYDRTVAYDSHRRCLQFQDRAAATLRQLWRWARKHVPERLSLRAPYGPISDVIVDQATMKGKVVYGVYRDAPIAGPSVHEVGRPLCGQWVLMSIHSEDVDGEPGVRAAPEDSEVYSTRLEEVHGRQDKDRNGTISETRVANGAIFANSTGKSLVPTDYKALSCIKLRGQRFSACSS